MEALKAIKIIGNQNDGRAVFLWLADNCAPRYDLCRYADIADSCAPDPDNCAPEPDNCAPVYAIVYHITYDTLCVPQVSRHGLS